MKISAFKIIKKSLPASIQSKFSYERGPEYSRIIIRGLGVTDVQNQIDQLFYWFKLMANEVDNFSKEKNIIVT